MWPYTFAIALIVIAQEINGEPHTRPSSATPLNSTLPPPEEDSSHNATDAADGSRISTILRDLPTIKNISIFICVLTTLLITCLVIKIFSLIRSAKKIRKTRKYDIITTPAERVEMAPLNEENDEDDDSTLFDVKYR